MLCVSLVLVSSLWHIAGTPRGLSIHGFLCETEISQGIEVLVVSKFGCSRAFLEPISGEFGEFFGCS